MLLSAQPVPTPNPQLQVVQVPQAPQLMQLPMHPNPQVELPRHPLPQARPSQQVQPQRQPPPDPQPPQQQPSNMTLQTEGLGDIMLQPLPSDFDAEAFMSSGDPSALLLNLQDEYKDEFNP